MKFRTVALVANRMKPTLVKELKAILNLYDAKEYDITAIHADQGFKCVREEVRPNELNACATDDHVHGVERSIRTVKERCRCTIAGLRFKRIPRVMCKQVVEKAVKNLNQFPSRDGIADNMSTLTMMTGRPFPEYEDFSLEFGTYVQVYEENDPTNTMKLRTTPAIAMNPTNILKGGYDFMSLVSGCKLERQQ